MREAAGEVVLLDARAEDGLEAVLGEREAVLGEGSEDEAAEVERPEVHLGAEQVEGAGRDEGVHDSAEEEDGERHHSGVPECEDEHDGEEALAASDLVGEECASEPVCGVAAVGLSQRRPSAPPTQHGSGVLD